MLPHNHFLIAGLAIAPVTAVLFPEKHPAEVVEWAVTGGLVSSAIDIDIFGLVLLMSRKEERLRLFRNPLEIFRKFRLFMDTITDTGILKIGMKTHVLFSVLMLLTCALFSGDHLVPVFLAVSSHLLTDIPNVKRSSA